MSQALFNARRGVTQVSSLVKQGKYIPAVQNTLAALRTLVTSSLMRAEQDELRRYISEACKHIANNADIKKIFPLSLVYMEGQEKGLQEILQELINVLESEASKGISLQEEELLQRKRASLEEAQELLAAGQHDKAKAMFATLVAEFPEDAQLAADIGDALLQAGLCEDAVEYFEKSIAISPDSAHVFNKMGIALRKLKRFDEAEKSFFRGLALEESDPNLHFNLGRVYLDMKRWDECIVSAEAALGLDATFTEAGQLAKYALRMKGN